MGTPIEDPTAGNDCPVCFPGGAPTYVWCLVTGMQIGDAWNPADPAAPNGVWELLQNPGFPCKFAFINATWAIQITFGNPNSSFSILYAPPFDAVFGHLAGACAWGYTNQFNNPVGHHYYGGSAQIFSSFAGTKVSMPDIADLIGHPKDSESFGDAFPVDGDTAVVRLGKRSLNSNILVKFNF